MSTGGLRRHHAHQQPRALVRERRAAAWRLCLRVDALQRLESRRRPRSSGVARPAQSPSHKRTGPMRSVQCTTGTLVVARATGPGEAFRHQGVRRGARAAAQALDAPQEPLQVLRRAAARSASTPSGARGAHASRCVPCTVHHSAPVALCAYHRFFYSQRPAFDEVQLLSECPPLLRAEVMEYITSRTLGQSRLLSRLDPDFRCDLFPCAHRHQTTEQKATATSPQPRAAFGSE